MSGANTTARAVLTTPLLIAAATLVGLSAALVGDGSWNVLSWLALSIPPFVALRCLKRRR